MHLPTQLSSDIIQMRLREEFVRLQSISHSACCAYWDIKDKCSLRTSSPIKNFLNICAFVLCCGMTWSITINETVYTVFSIDNNIDREREDAVYELVPNFARLHSSPRRSALPSRSAIAWTSIPVRCRTFALTPQPNRSEIARLNSGKLCEHFLVLFLFRVAQEHALVRDSWFLLYRKLKAAQSPIGEDRCCSTRWVDEIRLRCHLNDLIMQ